MFAWHFRLPVRAGAHPHDCGQVRDSDSAIRWSFSISAMLPSLPVTRLSCLTGRRFFHQPVRMREGRRLRRRVGLGIAATGTTG